jgi:bifunctional non-homologous end joining protein LigD
VKAENDSWGGLGCQFHAKNGGRRFNDDDVERVPIFSATVPMPPHVDPMLCTLVAKPFDDKAWVFEPKLDGLRVIARYDGKQLSLLSRNDKPQEFQFPEIVEALRRSLKVPAILDGEIVCLDEHGLPSFRKLQQRFHITDARTVQHRMAQFPAYIYLFDILYFEAEDVREQPLTKRKQILRRAISPWRKPLFWTEGIRGKGSELLDQICRHGGEGIVAKRLDSTYVSTRSGAWLKIKCCGRQEFVIGGWTDPQRTRVGLGALLVGYYSDDGQRLVYAGKVGTGFNNESLLDLRKQLETTATKRNPFVEGDPPEGQQVHWVKPRLVAAIAFAEWTQHDILRQPRFEGLREDKDPKDVRREKPKRLNAR